MSLLEILKYPDPFLSKRAEPVEEVTEEIQRLIDDMTDTMYHARGIGLAAVQVGVGKRVIVIDIPSGDDEERVKGKNLLALINPEIRSSEGSTKFEEGCLSVPGVTADVIRADKVTVTALDRKGDPVKIDAEGLLAIALQHEIDHLDGTLFIDRLSRLKRDLIKRKLKKALSQEVAL